jgi:hypothetical protein
VSETPHLDGANDPVFHKVGICHECSHRTTVRNCSAFPGGIPGVILVGRFDHTHPYPGDNGIQFDRKII